MCSRFELNSTSREIAQAFDLDDVPSLPNTSVLRPTDHALVIIGDQAQLQPWGLRVDWTKQPMINARAETLTEKPTFRGLLETRCVVPASSYFEWRTDDLGRKRKNTISLSMHPVFGFAGLTDGTHFTIVTCAPSPAIAHIHSRMPVILDAVDTRTWLSARPYADVSEVLCPYDGSFQTDEDALPEDAQPDLFG